MKNDSNFIEFFFVGLVLSFLAINYNFPLGTIYNMFTIFVLVSFIFISTSGYIKLIPIMDNSKKMESLLWGLGLGIGFIFFYNMFEKVTPMAQVFATTALGESQIIGKFVYGILIPLIETVLFFRIVLQFVAKFGNFELNPFSIQGTILNVIVSGAFTIFHLTAKGITNSKDLLIVFIFAYVSIFFVMYFKRVIEVILMHIIINSKSVGLFDITLTTTTYVYLIIGVFIVWYTLSNKKLSLS